MVYLVSQFLISRDESLRVSNSKKSLFHDDPLLRSFYETFLSQTRSEARLGVKPNWLVYTTNFYSAIAICNSDSETWNLDSLMYSQQSVSMIWLYGKYVALNCLSWVAEGVFCWKLYLILWELFYSIIRWNIFITFLKSL